MGKQKMVMKVPLEDAKKRSKALKVAVGLAGVMSAQIDGEKIVVVGDGVDSVALTVMLRKKMGFAELVSVGLADEKKDKPEDRTNESVQQMVWPSQVPMTYMYETRDPCSIL